MGLAIGGALRTTDEEKRKLYLKAGRAASVKVHKLLDELREKGQSCGQL